MPNTKKFLLDAYDKSITVYIIVTRESDGYFLNSAGAFVAAIPTFPSTIEDSLIPSRYNYSTAVSVWTDGRYIVRYQQMLGATQDLGNDPIVGIGEMIIQNDSEIDIYSPERSFGGEGV